MAEQHNSFICALKPIYQPSAVNRHCAGDGVVLLDFENDVGDASRPINPRDFGDCRAGIRAGIVAIRDDSLDCRTCVTAGISGSDTGGVPA
jgi:hypothetical protein